MHLIRCRGQLINGGGPSFELGSRITAHEVLHKTAGLQGFYKYGTDLTLPYMAE
jgi:hypothetical protein